MADEGVGEIFFPRKKKKPPDKRTVTVETADEKATSDSKARQLPTRGRRTNDQGVLTPHACDQEVRCPLATAENATDAAATITAAARQWQPTHQLTRRHFWASGGSHPPFTRDLECAADEDVDSRSGDVWGLSWELAVGGVPWRRPKAPPLSLPPPEPLPSGPWQPTHQLTRRQFWASGGSHPQLRHRPFTCDPAARERKGDLAGSWLWGAVGG